MGKLTDQQIHVMRHACGMDSDAPFFRNRFVAGAGHADYATLESLCELGLMERVPGGLTPKTLTGGGEIFYVTEEGKEKLIELGARP